MHLLFGAKVAEKLLNSGKEKIISVVIKGIVKCFVRLLESPQISQGEKKEREIFAQMFV
jgi:hypothetical protein